MIEPSALTKVRPKVFITNVETGQNFELLSRTSVDAILCLQRMDLPAALEREDFPFTYAFRPLKPGGDTPRAFREAVKTLGTLLQNGNTVTVHCYHGQGRSVAVVAAHLVVTENLTPSEVLDEVATLRGVAGKVPRRYEHLVANYRG